jgi:hypothetical protein
MGVVFLGRHTRLGRMVAIKELPPSFSADPEVRARFSTEARTLASLSHPHIVPIYDYVEREGLCLIVMEQLPGGTVWDRFTSTGLTPPTACAVALACCAALQHAHDKGVLHLDVKPDNLMFATDKAIRVTDFGISRVLSGDQTLGTRDGQVLGTPAYMSPEQARGSELTLASDVYSTGVMLYELLSGHLPWVGAETATELLLKRLREDPRPLRSIAPQVPQGLADVVMKSIEREPEDRYKGAEEFGIAVATACADAWGPGWLDQGGVALIGSEKLSLAARTTRTQAPVTAAGGTGARAAATSAQSAPGENRVERAGETMSPAAFAAAGIAGEAAPSVPEARPAEPPVFEAVRAAGSEPRIEGADFNAIDRRALVSVAEVMARPKGARLALVVGLLLIAGAVVSGALLFKPIDRTGTLKAADLEVAGARIGSKPVPLDLSSNLPVRVVNPRYVATADHLTLRLSLAGITVRELSTPLLAGRGQLDTKIARYVASGSLEGRIELTAKAKSLAFAEFRVKATQPWYSTAEGILGVLVILAGLAYLEGAIRPLRAGRRRISAFIGAGIATPITAVGVVALFASLGHADPKVSGLVVVAVLSTLGGVALAFAAYRRGSRLSMRRAVRRAVLKPQQDPAQPVDYAS